MDWKINEQTPIFTIHNESYGKNSKEPVLVDIFWRPTVG